MGKAQRLKGRNGNHGIRPARPRWAGADGFDNAWALTERYCDLAEQVWSDDEVTRATAALTVLEFRQSLAYRQVATLEEYLVLHGDSRKPNERQSVPVDDAPDDWDLATAIEPLRPYVAGLSTLAREHRAALTEATPVLFDPLTAPAADAGAVDGLRLPFPVVICDFLNAQGMSMPTTTAGGTGEWVGLVAATFVQQADDIIDVWPVVTTLCANEDRGLPRRPESLLLGRVRFGGVLPEPPEGLVRVEVAGASAWVVREWDERDEDEAIRAAVMWANIWIVMPALAAASALRLLEAVNVSLLPAELPRPVRRRAAREGAEIPLEVVIRSSRREGALTAGSTVEWQHRWTVRGHWKHFTKGPVFNANPRKRVFDANGIECVRVWCPPFVKGPDDRPLVLKARRMDHEREQVPAS